MGLKYVSDDGKKEYSFDYSEGFWSFRGIRVPAHVDGWISEVVTYADTHLKNKKRDFDPDSINLDTFVFEPDRWLPEIVEELNRIRPDDMKEFDYKLLVTWLEDKGYLRIDSDSGYGDIINNEFTAVDEKTKVILKRVPTEAGQRLGISKVIQTDKEGQMSAKYSVKAQRYILDHIEEIVWPDIQ